MVRERDWFKCYSGGWTNEIVPEAFSHPAKFARGLIRRIYEHALEQGYLREGDMILDPFDGIALGAADALANGLNFVGVELEQFFVDLGGGCDCTGISKEDWVACFGRWKRFAYKDDRHWCPRCLAQAEQIIDECEAPKLTQTQAKRRVRMRELITKTGRKVDFSLYVPIPFPESHNRPAETLRLFGADSLAASYQRSSGKIPHTELHHYTGNLELFARHARNGATAVLIQGDSRRLVEVLDGARAEGIISSPPWTNNQEGASVAGPSSGMWKGYEAGFRPGGKTYSSSEEKYGTSPANLGNMPTGEPPQAIVSSPPYAQSGVPQSHGRSWRVELSEIEGSWHKGGSQCGESDGQLAAMREGNVDAVIASPPYAKAAAHPSIGSVNKDDWGHNGHGIVKRRGLSAEYGSSDGQLAGLPEGEPPAGIISSPPFSTPGNQPCIGQGVRKDIEAQGRSPEFIFDTLENLSNIKGDTFWSAARAILQQCYQVLAPGGVAIFVTKRFVRDKKIVEFSQQWADLCQSCGFELIEWIKAWLVEERGTQYDLTGEAHTKTVKRFSFFRRLHVKKYPHLAIEWEDVLIFRKGKKPCKRQLRSIVKTKDSAIQ